MDRLDPNPASRPSASISLSGRDACAVAKTAGVFALYGLGALAVLALYPTSDLALEPIFLIASLMFLGFWRLADNNARVYAGIGVWLLTAFVVVCGIDGWLLVHGRWTGQPSMGHTLLNNICGTIFLLIVSAICVVFLWFTGLVAMNLCACSRAVSGIIVSFLTDLARHVHARMLPTCDAAPKPTRMKEGPQA